MGCFTFLSTATVIVFVILLPVTTPILVLRKFLSAIFYFSFEFRVQSSKSTNDCELPTVNRLCFEFFFLQFRFQTSNITAEISNCHWTFQWRNGMSKLQFL